MKQKKKVKNSIKENYVDSWNFIKGSKEYIWAIIFIFFLFAFVGFFVPVPEELATSILDFIQQLLEKTRNMGFIELWWFILWNNIKVSFLGMVAGVILGIFSISASIANGYLLGFVSHIVSREEGIMSLWRILPHGIFELPAIFVSLGLGLNLGLFIFRRKKSKVSFKELLAGAVKAFILIIIPLLVVASIIESSFIVFSS